MHGAWRLLCDLTVLARPMLVARMTGDVVHYISHAVLILLVGENVRIWR